MKTIITMYGIRSTMIMANGNGMSMWSKRLRKVAHDMKAQAALRKASSNVAGYVPMKAAAPLPQKNRRVEREEAERGQEKQERGEREESEKKRQTGERKNKRGDRENSDRKKGK
jgi:hypothetical protein